MSLLSPPLEAFLAIVRHNTVQAASKGLGLTQTGVTQRIRGLETSLGVSLFTRSRKGMRLTSEGEALLHYCQGSIELEGEALAHIKGAGKAALAQVVISGPSSLMRSRIIPQCKQVFDEYSELFFRFDLDDEENGADKLRQGKTDLAIVAPEAVALEMDSKLLKKERYILVGPKKWKDRSLEEIIKEEAIVDFDMEDKMTQSYLSKFDLLPKALPVRHFANNTDALADMVSMGAGYTVMTEEFARTLIQSEKIIELHPNNFMENKIALAWYPRPQMPAYFKALVKSIK